jgi:hypothetical protein
MIKSKIQLNLHVQIYQHTIENTNTNKTGQQTPHLLSRLPFVYH